jgi:hypothetical protein
VLTACSILYLYPFMHLLLNCPDEGTLIYGAERVAEGQVPFRDFFEAMGPGTFYWLALFFKLFGTTWVATRISLLLTCLATILLMFHLSRRLHARFETVSAVVLFGTLGPLWPAVSHHSDSTVFALLSFAVLLWSLENARPILFFATGLLAGITTCFLQTKGCFLFVSYLLIVWLLFRGESKLRNSALWLVAGYVAVIASVVLLFWTAGALPDLIYANVVWPLTRYGYANAVPYGLGAIDFYWQKWTSTFVPLFSPVLGYSVSAVLFVPFLLVMALPFLLVAFGVFKRSLAFTRATVPYWGAGVALWLSEIHRKDIGHLSFGSPLLLILFFYLCPQLRLRWLVSILQFVTVCALVLAGFNGLFAMSARTEIDTPRGVVHTFGSDPVLAFLNAHAGEEIFAYPSLPTNCFLAAAKNPTRFSLLVYRMHTNAQFREAVRSLDDKKVRYVLWNPRPDDPSIKWLNPLGWSRPPDNELIIEPYLRQNYDVIFEHGTVRVLERKRATAEQGSPAGLASH